MLPCFYHDAKSYETLKQSELLSIFYKHKAWSYEEEVRIIFKQPYITIKPTTIYLGCKMCENDKKFLTSVFNDETDDKKTPKIPVSDLIAPQTFGYKNKGKWVRHS